MYKTDRRGAQGGGGFKNRSLGQTQLMFQLNFFKVLEIVNERVFSLTLTTVLVSSSVLRYI